MTRGRLVRALLVVLALAAAGAACQGNGPESEASEFEGRAGDGFSVRDQAGNLLEMEAPPRRIVSLVPAATASLLALGAGDLLVARTEYDAEPELADLPSVGQGLHPSIEGLVSLSPELVIRFEGEQDRVTPLALDRAGIPHLGVRPDRIDDVLEMIRLLGRVTQRSAQGDSIVTAIRTELERVRERVRDVRRPRVAFLLGGDPPWAVAGGTFLHELLEIAGGRNALADAGTLYAPVSVEAIVTRDVGAILTLNSAPIPPALDHLPLIRVSDAVQSPGPGLARSARDISRALHPEVWLEGSPDRSPDASPESSR